MQRWMWSGTFLYVGHLDESVEGWFRFFNEVVRGFCEFGEAFWWRGNGLVRVDSTVADGLVDAVELRGEGVLHAEVLCWLSFGHYQQSSMHF